MNGLIEGWTDRWMDGWIDGWMDGWMDRWMDRQMDEWTDKWMMDGLTDTRLKRQNKILLINLIRIKRNSSWTSFGTRPKWLTSSSCMIMRKYM